MRKNKIAFADTALEKTTGLLTAIATGLAGIFIVLTAAIVCYEVVMRGIFNSPTEWSIELSVYLVLASGFLGLAGALADDKHIKVDILISRLSARTNNLLSILTAVLGLVFSIIFLTESWDMVISSFELGRTSTSTLRVPLYIPQASVPFGALLLVLQFLRQIVKLSAELFTGRDGIKHLRAER